MADPNMSNPTPGEAPLSDKPIEPASPDLAAALDAGLDTVLAEQKPYVDPADDDSDPSPEELAAAPPEEEEAAAAPTEPSGGAAQPAQEEPPAEEAPPADDPLARGLKALEHREKAAEERVARAKLVETENVGLKKQLADERELAVKDPERYYREVLGVGKELFADLAADFYVAGVGEKAPAALREQVEKKRADRVKDLELAALKREKQEQQQRQVEQNLHANQVSYLERVADNIPDTLPWVKAQAKHNKKVVAQVWFRKIYDMNAAGEFADCATEDAAIAKAAMRMNEEIENNVKWALAVQALKEGKPAVPPPATAAPKVAPQTPTPVAEKKLPAPKTLNRNTVPTKTPKKAPAATEDDLVAQLAAELKAL